MREKHATNLEEGRETMLILEREEARKKLIIQNSKCLVLVEQKQKNMRIIFYVTVRRMTIPMILENLQECGDVDKSQLETSQLVYEMCHIDMNLKSFLASS